MSFAYTEKLKPIIIGLLEQGESVKDIARLYNVSIWFVRKVRDNYDEFYSNIFQMDKLNRG